MRGGGGEGSGRDEGGRESGGGVLGEEWVEGWGRVVGVVGLGEGRGDDT